MTVAPAEPAGAPKIIFASIDAAYARELEPLFAAAGCAVVSNSSAFRMAPNVPLVLPEVNADHLHLIEEQSWRKESGGYIVTNSNCTVMGPVLALKPIAGPLRHRADLRHLHAGGQRRGLPRRRLHGHLRQRRPLHPQ
jgi:aspartate-semialdehyde dehydrogenase